MPNVIIPTDHPDADSPLLHAAAEAFVTMGAEVNVTQGGENLVRRLVNEPAELAPSERGSVPNRAGHPIVRVQAEGLPNLLHELVHAVQAARLDDDHGIDYSAIPFDLETARGRAVLWDELACCAVSCAYLWAHGRVARAGGDLAGVRAEVEDWFREQVEIQPVFYGMESDPSAFVERVSALLHEHGVEARAHFDRAYAATEFALSEAGASSSLATAPRRLTVHDLWAGLNPCPESMERA